MIDDLKMIHTRDSADGLGAAEKMPRQLLQPIEIPPELASLGGKNPIANIVYWGEGVMTLAAGLVRVWPGSSVPFEVTGSQTLPSYVGVRTLVIIADWTGSDSNSLAVLRFAKECGAQVMVITSGGRLAAAAQAEHDSLVRMPSGLRDGQLLITGVGILAAVLQAAGVAAGPPVNMVALVRWLDSEVAAWLPTVTTAHNEAKQIALELVGKSVVLGSGPLMEPAIQAWKWAINTNAKQLAWCSRYPAAGSGLAEAAAWTKQPVTKLYAVVDIHSSLDEPRVTGYFKQSERLLSGLRPSPVVVQADGRTLLEQLLYVICLGEFVSLYLALLAGTDPLPADVVSKFT